MTPTDVTTPCERLATLTAGVRPVRRPRKGWLRTVREARGLSRQSVAEQLDVSQAAVRDFELAETTDTITLRTLRRTARALGCELVIALVPTNHRSFVELAGALPRSGGARAARAVEAPPVETTRSDPDELDLYLR